VAFIYIGKATTYSHGAAVPDPIGGSPGSPEYFGNVSAESATGTMSRDRGASDGGLGRKQWTRCGVRVLDHAGLSTLRARVFTSPHGHAGRFSG
jgi:hypothetical protein